MAEEAAAALAERGMVTADGKISAWFTIHQQATKTVAMLALRLRLGPQSRAPRTPKRQAAVLSYYELSALEGSRETSEGEDGAG
jgi:hypothetical protein